MQAHPHEWALFRAAGYFIGKGISFGCWPPLIPPQSRLLDRYAIEVFPHHQACPGVVADNLAALANGQFQYVLVGQALEAVLNPGALIGEAAAKLQLNGHLVVFVPLGSPASQSVRHTFTPDGIRGLVAGVADWQEKDQWEQSGRMVQVYKKLGSGHRRLRPPRPAPSGYRGRACVARYGAFGDLVAVTPLLRALATDNWHVTVNIGTYSAVALNENPNIHNVILQEKDMVPNHRLGPYWDIWRPEYDRYINLSESVEGRLLIVEGRPEFYTPQSWRQAHTDENYYEATLAAGGYPGAKPTGELFFTRAEERTAEAFRKEHQNRFVVLWSLRGSSEHKRYALMQTVLTEWLDGHPDARVVTVGDHMARLLEFEHPQVIQAAGVWDIRRVFCATRWVDLVVGPETGVLNAAGCWDVPKIVFLSHSTPRNLTTHWPNTTVLEPDREVVPCYPCHQLHYTKESCPQGQLIDRTTGAVLVEGPACSVGGIPGAVVLSALERVYEDWQAHRYPPPHRLA